MSTVTTTGESAPSRLRSDEPTLARYAGGIGWGIVVIGLIGVTFNRFFDTPRLLVPSEGWGWLFVLVGLTAALIHASVETDLLLRRVLGVVGLCLVVVGVGWGGAMAFKERSWALGLIPALPGFFLVMLYVRRENDSSIRRPALMTLGSMGLLLAAGGILGTWIAPQWLAARFSVMMALGFILVLTHISIAGVTDDLAYYFALALGGLGVVAIVSAIVRSVYPTLLYEWRQPAEYTAVLALACGLALLILGAVAAFVLGRSGEGTSNASSAAVRSWGRVGIATGVLLLLLALLRYLTPGMLENTGRFVQEPEPYLVPTGFVLMGVGLIYLLLAVGFVSENRLVVLTRREFTTFFVSPIAYCVLIGFVLIATPSYWLFLGLILRAAEVGQVIEEPIVQRYVIAFLPVVAVMLSVPLLTMRLFAEERRTGTLEVLLTAPVNDWLIVLSKWLASWMFFMLIWSPWWLFLLALRLEGGKEFDFRPMIGFSLALAACGAGFTAMGMFFSSLTRDQIISAALTFMGMMLLVGFFFAEQSIRGASGFEVTAKKVMRALSFVHMWIEATNGKLYVRDIVVQLSFAVFWVVGTVKVLESRRWS